MDAVCGSRSPARRFSYPDRLVAGWQLQLVHQPLLPIAVAISLGIFLASKWSGPWWSWWLVQVALLTISWQRAARHPIGLRRARGAWVWLGGWLALVALGGGYQQLHQRSLWEETLSELAGAAWEPVLLEGTVCGSPSWLPDTSPSRRPSSRLSVPSAALGQMHEAAWLTRLELQVTAIRSGRSWKQTKGKTHLLLPGRSREFLPGDRLSVAGQWQRIPAASNPGEFDRAEHWFRYGHTVRVRCQSTRQVTCLQKGHALNPHRWLAAIAAGSDRLLQRWVAYGEAPLAAALVLGQRDQVDWEVRSRLLETGTIHLLAISGLHVEMLAASLLAFAFLCRCPRRATLLVMVLLVVFYAALTGGRPPVVRATVLVAGAALARWHGRSTPLINLLAAAALLLLLRNPAHLTEVGVQLSFLAVLTLGLLSRSGADQAAAEDPLKRLLQSTAPAWQQRVLAVRSGWWRALTSSGWVWLLTSPLVLAHFHIFSPIAIPLNVLLTPLLLVALLSGLAVLLTGAWCWPAAWLAGWMCGLALAGIDQLVTLARLVPGAYWWLPAPSSLWLLGFYGTAVGVWILVGFGTVVRRWLGALLVGWLLVGVGPSIAGQAGWGLASRALAPGRLQLTFIDMGHGLSVLIETPDRQLWLYDAGQLGSNGRSFLPIAAVLWDRGATRLDGVLLSHADADHYNALPELYERFPFPRLITTEQVLASTGGDLETILGRLKAAGVELQCVTAGDQRRPRIDGTDSQPASAEKRWRVLHPPSETADLGNNASSLCLLIEHMGRRIVLTGDLEPPGTEMFLSHLETPIQVDLLLAPHHGSLTHDPRSLMEATEPTHVVISGGLRSARPQVQTAFSGPHIQLWTTYLHGAIRVCVDSLGEIEVRHWQAGCWSISQGAGVDRTLSGESTEHRTYPQAGS
jgi:competence protein ComEC